MNPALAGLAVATLAAGVLAVTARDVRTVVLGLLVVLLTTPLISDPWPSPASILVRLAAALLAGRLVATGARGLDATAGDVLGWPTVAALGVAGAIAGWASHGLGAPALGPGAASAAAFGLIAVAVGPLLTGRDVVRVGVAALLVLAAGDLLRTALDRPLSDGDQLVVALLVVGAGGALGVVTVAARAAGGLEAAPLEPRTGRRWPDAHPLRLGAAGTARPGGASEAPAANIEGTSAPTPPVAAPTRRRRAARR